MAIEREKGHLNKDSGGERRQNRERKSKSAFSIIGTGEKFVDTTQVTN